MQAKFNNTAMTSLALSFVTGAAWLIRLWRWIDIALCTVVPPDFSLATAFSVGAVRLWVENFVVRLDVFVRVYQLICSRYN
jgi:hypothetical protein